jgi:putative chitinase
MTLTAEQIRAIAPRARDDYVAAIVGGKAVFEQYGFNTPMRLAGWIAQAAHETGGFVIVREATNYTAANILACWPNRFNRVTAAALARRGGMAVMNTVYGPTMVGKALGNTCAGDGYSFRGGSLAQTTGRDNYTRIGQAIGVDLAGHPELIEDASIGLQAACFELSKYLSFMDMGERGLKAVSNGLNRGNPHSSANPIGWEDRQHWFRVVCDHLGVNPADASEPAQIRIGDSSDLVKGYQARLAALGYAVGKQDGVYGSQTRASVLAFQAENELATDGKVGPHTRAALESPDAKPMPKGDRATETKDDLAAEGSTTIINAEAQRKIGGTVAAVGGVTGLVQSLPIPASDAIVPGLKTVMDDFGTFRLLTTGVTDALHWMGSHWYIAAIALGYLVYRWGGKIIAARLADHRAGLNLSR